MNHEPARLYTPNERNALIQAALAGDWQTIDKITDSLVEQGLCRPRSDTSRLAEWIAKRPKFDTGTVESTTIGSQIAQQLRSVF